MILLAAIALRFVTVLPVSQDYAYRILAELSVETFAIYAYLAFATWADLRRIRRHFSRIEP